VSSILEALRELEGDRPPAVRRELPPPEVPPSVARRASGAMIPVLGGLAVGVVAFGIYAWGPRVATPPTAVAPAPVAPAPVTPAADAQPAERPNWLDSAAPPRAKVGRTATAPTPPAAPERAATADRPAAAPAKPASDAVAADAPHDETPTQRADSGTSSGGQVAVEKIAYSENAAERVVTMRFKGRRVTLRQREAIDGIEVQLIMPNAVYVQRGAETYLLPLSR